MVIPDKPIPVNTTEMHWRVIDGLGELQKAIPTLPADVAENTEKIKHLQETLEELKKPSAELTKFDERLKYIEEVIKRLPPGFLKK